jgi:hypothetical protein
MQVSQLFSQSAEAADKRSKVGAVDNPRRNVGSEQEFD